MENNGNTHINKMQSKKRTVGWLWIFNTWIWTFSTVSNSKEKTDPWKPCSGLGPTYSFWEAHGGTLTPTREQLGE